MPRRSSVELMPKATREWLDKVLIQGSFSGYEALAQELRVRGYEISKSALHRYGSKFEERLARMRQGAQQAAALAEALPDDAGQLGDAVTRLIQQQVFDALMEAGDLDLSEVKITEIGTMMAKLNTAGVQQKKWAADVRAKTKATAETVEKIARDAGMTPKLADDLKRHVLGIVA